MSLDFELIEDTLRNVFPRLPAHPRVKELRYLVDQDPQGEEVVIVYIILADENATPVPSREALSPIEETIRAEFSKVSDGWVYFRFRSDSEQRAEDARRGFHINPRRCL